MFVLKGPFKALNLGIPFLNSVLEILQLLFKGEDLIQVGVQGAVNSEEMPLQVGEGGVVGGAPGPQVENDVLEDVGDRLSIEEGSAALGDQVFVLEEHLG